MVLFHATTIVAVKSNNDISIAGDGQVTMGESTIIKSSAKKIRRLYNNQVLAGFAGSVSDAFTLFDLFERELESSSGNLLRAAISLTKSWRNDSTIRSLEALMILADKNELIIVSGNGEIILPEDGVCAIGSGGNYALAAAKALKENTDLSSKEIAVKSINIASSICVFTNNNITCETLEAQR